MAEKMATSQEKELETSTSKESTKSDSSELKSIVDKAEPLDCFNASNLSQALDTSWCFGFNATLPVHNISTGERKAVFYVAAHTGVIYDLEGNRQCFLKCHSNPIASTAVSKDRRWLLTADIGRDCCLTVWDSFSGIPVKTIYDHLGNGVLATAFSHDAKYIATISQQSPQTVNVWDWTSDKEGPCCSVQLKGVPNRQEVIVFSENDSSQLVSNGDEQVIFYHRKDTQLEYDRPELTDATFNKVVGFLTVSTFISGSDLAFSGTSEGSGVVWEVDRRAKPRTDGSVAPHVRVPSKLMKMHASPITAVTVINSYLVTGDSAGELKFYDSDFKMINWYDSWVGYGPVASISFGFYPKAARQSTMATKSGDPIFTQSTIEGRVFSVADFTVSTTSACLAYVSVKDASAQLIFSDHNTAVNALATHPKEPRVLIGSYSGKLKLWDYSSKLSTMSREMGEGVCLQCVAFDPTGSYAGVGCTDGSLFVVDPVTLDDVCPPFNFSKDCITHVSFSQDCKYMATADLDYCVIVYSMREVEEGGLNWAYLGKYRAHYKPITGLLFTVHADSSRPRLLSIGQDRHLVEYDLIHSAEDDLRLLSSERIELSAVPLSLELFPRVTKEPFLLTANSQYKLKMYNATTKMCRRTLLGPLYGTPLRKLAVLPSVGSDSVVESRRYLAYITRDKVGLLLLPHDGNPHNTVAFSAHPGQVTELSCSHDGRYVFTSGGEDCIVTMWRVYPEALETSMRLGGEGLVPFYRMLEGGEGGRLFAELEDYFYYAQIKSQGSSTAETRQTSTTILLDQVPSVMRAIGYYPTEQEIVDMLNEVKFSEYVETGKYVTAIDLGDFIKLYVNHRPAFGLSPQQLTEAFRVLGSRPRGQEWSIPRTQLLAMLQDKGESIVDEELVEHLMTLLGCCTDPEEEGSYTQSPATALAGLLGDDITLSQFAHDLLGLEL